VNANEHLKKGIVNGYFQIDQILTPALREITTGKKKLSICLIGKKYELVPLLPWSTTRLGKVWGLAI
jgi:hypothetical protein